MMVISLVVSRPRRVTVGAFAAPSLMTLSQRSGSSAGSGSVGRLYRHDHLHRYSHAAHAGNLRCACDDCAAAPRTVSIFAGAPRVGAARTRALSEHCYAASGLLRRHRGTRFCWFCGTSSAAHTSTRLTMRMNGQKNVIAACVVLACAAIDRDRRSVFTAHTPRTASRICLLCGYQHRYFLRVLRITRARFAVLQDDGLRALLSFMIFLPRGIFCLSLPQDVDGGC
jgi:hypothetical protein